MPKTYQKWRKSLKRNTASILNTLIFFSNRRINSNLKYYLFIYGKKGE